MSKTGTRRTPQEKAGIALGVVSIAILLTVLIAVLAAFIFPDTVINIFAENGEETYTEFTPALKRTLKTDYCLDIPDSAELTYGEYRGSWDFTSLEVSFLVRADEFEGMLTDGAWTESEGDRHAIAVYTLSSGRKRSGAKLTVKYYDGCEELYSCYLKYGAY